MITRLLAMLALTMLAQGCVMSTMNRSETLNPSGLFEGDSEIGRTFEMATLVLPRRDGEPFVGKFADRNAWQDDVAALPGKMPAVLYLHGCTGLRNLDPLIALGRAGLVVVAPDSFARRFRPLQCRPSRQTGGENIYVYDFRLTEISYALHRIRQLPWIDTSRLMLMGVSEGGVAAALYRGDEFRARVIAQWTCHGRPFVRGLAAGSGEAILSVVHRNDPWYDEERTDGQQGDCGSFLDERALGESIVLDGQAEHDVFSDISVMQKVTQFLYASMN